MDQFNGDFNEYSTAFKLAQVRCRVLQSFVLIIPFYFSLILIVYLLGEVDVITPILLFFSFVPYLHFASLTFLWT